MTIRRTGIALFCLCLGLGGTLMAGWEAPLPEGKSMKAAIPRLAAPPTIDGTVNGDEWQGAMATSGVGGCMDNKLYARPTIYWLGWDEDRIYVASRIWIRPGYKPAVSGREPGAAVVFDDTLEFHWLPLGKNVPDGRTSSSYKWLINALGFDGDLMRVSVGQQFKNWKPDFTIASRLTDTGTAPAGGRWLEIEFSSSWKDFELSGPHRAGDEWKMMLGTNHMYAGWDQARIPCTTSYFDPPGYAVFTLTDDQPAVQLLMDDYPMPNEGTLKARWQIQNPTASPVELTLLTQVTAMDPKALDGGAELLKQEQTVTVAAGMTETVGITGDYGEKLGEQKGGLFFQVQNKEGVLYRHFTYFMAGFPEVSRQPAPKPQRAFPLDLRFNPVSNQVQVKTDAYYLDDPAAAQEVRWQVRPKGSANALQQGAIKTAVNDFFAVRVALGELPPGEYEVEATMVLRDGKTLGPELAPFKKLDEAKEYKAWWNTKLGNIERVIHPFTGIKKQENTVSPWGRSYTLNALGLPSAVVSAGKPVTAGVARIVVVVAGKESVIPVDAAPEFTETKDWRVRFRGAAKGEGLTFNAEGWLEQDGLVCIELTYGPEGEPVKVDALRFEFPLSGVEGETLLCLGTGGNYAARTTMVLPPDKQGQLWSTLVTGLNGAQMTLGNFYPCVWVGNEQRGLLWWGDSDQGWVPANDVPAHEVLRQGKDLVLRNNIIGKPLVISAKRAVTFTYMASPFRPLLKNRRAVMYSENGTFHGPNKIAKDEEGKTLVDGWAWLTPPSEKPEEWAAMWAGYKKLADERCRQIQWREPALARNKYGSTVHTSLPLMGYDWKSPDKRVTSYFEPAWTRSDVWSRTEQDYFLYIADRAFGEGGLRTIYWDIFMLHLFKDPLAGVGYALPDGRIQPAYNGLNLRRFVMRMYALMGDHGLTPGSQVAHCTNDYLLVGAGWTDALLDGEYHSLGDDSTMDWVDGYPVDRMRAMSVSGTFGNQITWMSLISISDLKRRDLVYRGKRDYTRLYDTWRDWGGLWMPPFDWGLNEMEYQPFWRSPNVSSSNKDVLISAWAMPGRTVLAVFNDNGKDLQSTTIKLDRKGLGLTVKEPWLGGIAVRGLQGVAPEYNPLTDTIQLNELQPHTGAVIALRATERPNYEHLLKALQQAAEVLPAEQQPTLVPDVVLNFGMADAPVKVLPSGQAVTSDDAGVVVTAMSLPDRILIAIANPGAKEVDATLKVDLDQLKLVPVLPWQEFVQERDFGPGARAAAKLDFHGRTMQVPHVQPGTLRLVAIRRY